MKRPGLPVALSLATLFVVTGLHGADIGAPVAATPLTPASGNVSVKVERARESTPAMKAMDAAAILKRFDKNGDGKLDEDEAAEAHEVMLKEQVDRQAVREAAQDAEQFRQRMLRMFDKNHDGRLDETERAEARKYAEEHKLLGPGETQREEVMKRFDRNGDGRPEEDERAEMRKAPTPLGRGSGGVFLGGMKGEILRRFDKNGDGRIDDAEFAALEPLLRVRIETLLQQLRRYDKNNDGKIDDAEWAQAAEQLRHWLDDAPLHASTKAAAKLSPTNTEVPANKPTASKVAESAPQ